jgi:hypothetical protein
MKAAADSIRAEIEKSDLESSATIVSAGKKLRGHFDEWGGTVRRNLEEKLEYFKEIGCPPSFPCMAGVNGYEKPLNKIIGWWAKPFSGHGAGRSFLVHLAQRLNFSSFREDLDFSSELEVYSEEPVHASSGLEPDLFVITKSSALLFENKYGSGQSGNSQYDDYYDLLMEIAGSRKLKSMAVFCTRHPQLVPPKWNCTLVHSDIEEIFKKISLSVDVPLWSRISAIICSVSFQEIQQWEIIRVAEDLLRETTRDKYSANEIMKMCKILNIITNPCIPLSKGGRNAP